METKEIAKKKWWKRRWTIGKDIKAREADLEKLRSTDEQYQSDLDGIEKMVKIRNSKIESVTKVFQAVGTLALGAAVAVAAYSIDKSDDIPRNKQSMNLFSKVFRI